MIRARIWQQPRTAMQSGAARTQDWVLSFEQADQRRADPLMGWISSADTQSQVALRFATRDEAVAYAERRGWTFEVELAHPKRIPPKAYADNFRSGRTENWTH